MLDPDDEKVIKECKENGGVLVTWDRVLRQAAGGLTPYEILDQAIAKGEGTPEAKAEVSRLRSLSPEELTSLAVDANKTYELFRNKVIVDKVTAKLIRFLRVSREYSWRAIARHCSVHQNLPFGGNQIAGMVICQKSAEVLGEDFMKPPWN